MNSDERLKKLSQSNEEKIFRELIRLPAFSKTEEIKSGPIKIENKDIKDVLCSRLVRFQQECNRATEFKKARLAQEPLGISTGAQKFRARETEVELRRHGLDDRSLLKQKESLKEQILARSSFYEKDRREIASFCEKLEDPRVAKFYDVREKMLLIKNSTAATRIKYDDLSALKKATTIYAESLKNNTRHLEVAKADAKTDELQRKLYQLEASAKSANSLLGKFKSKLIDFTTKFLASNGSGSERSDFIKVETSVNLSNSSNSPSKNINHHTKSIRENQSARFEERLQRVRGDLKNSEENAQPKEHKFEHQNDSLEKQMPNLFSRNADGHIRANFTKASGLYTYANGGMHTSNKSRVFEEYIDSLEKLSESFTQKKDYRSAERIDIQIQIEKLDELEAKKIDKFEYTSKLSEIQNFVLEHDQKYQVPTNEEVKELSDVLDRLSTSKSDEITCRSFDFLDEINNEFSKVEQSIDRRYERESPTIGR